MEPARLGKGASARVHTLRSFVAVGHLASADTLADLVVMMGYQVRVSYFGQDVLDVASAHPTDVAVLESGLADVSGVE